jgi:hypothetical protein
MIPLVAVYNNVRGATRRIMNVYTPITFQYRSSSANKKNEFMDEIIHYAEQTH